MLVCTLHKDVLSGLFTRRQARSQKHEHMFPGPLILRFNSILCGSVPQRFGGFTLSALFGRVIAILDFFLFSVLFIQSRLRVGVLSPNLSLLSFATGMRLAENRHDGSEGHTDEDYRA